MALQHLRKLEVIQLVKDYLILNGRANNVQVTKPLMKKCKESRVQWQEDLRIQRELQQKEEDEKRVAASKSAEQEAEKEKASPERYGDHSSWDYHFRRVNESWATRAQSSDQDGKSG